MKPFSNVLVRVAVAGALLGAFALGVHTAGAQTPDARWQPWMGCWQPSDAPSQGIAANNTAAGLVCVVPAVSGTGVEVATISNGVVAHSERLNPTGARVAKTVDNCPGWESATWSADGRRVMLRSEYLCGNSTRVRGSGVFAISPNGEWIQVQGSSVGASVSARAVRYRPESLQLERVAGEDSTRVHLVRMLTGFSTISARSLAGEAVHSDDVLEVVRNVDGPVAEAWLNEVEQRFVLNARELVRLADAGMPPRMIDLMIALSYPQRFAVKRTEPVRADIGGGAVMSGFGGGYGLNSSYGSGWDCGYGSQMLSYGYYGSGCYPGNFGYGYSAYRRFGTYGAYGYGPFGYNGYGYGYGGYTGGYYTGQQPVIIIQRVPDSQTSIEGRAVNGSGYTRRTPQATSPTNRSSASSSSGSSGGGSSSSGSTGGGSSGGSSSGSSGGGDRTAKPRVPPG